MQQLASHKAMTQAVHSKSEGSCACAHGASSEPSEWHFDPIDGRPAFKCLAVTREEAIEKYNDFYLNS